MPSQSVLTCPLCSHKQKEAVPEEACQPFYICQGCGKMIQTKKESCCVFCSYGDVPCPAVHK